MPQDLSQNNNPQQFCIILTTTDSRVIANEMAEALIETNLASCVQMDNITSIYKWNGKTTSSSEFRLMIKAKSNNYNQIQDLLVTMHNYEVPEIIKLDIADGLTSYLNWLNQDL